MSVECLSVNESENSTPNCRICQISGNSEAEIGELIVSPCDCRGSLGFVHKLCIEKWLRLRDQDTCELCHFKFVTKRRFKPLHEVGWISTSSETLLALGKTLFCLLREGAVFVFLPCWLFSLRSLLFFTQNKGGPGPRALPPGPPA